MDLKIWRRTAVERSGRGEKRETHGERQEADEARRRLVARTAAARRNRLDEFQSVALSKWRGRGGRGR